MTKTKIPIKKILKEIHKQKGFPTGLPNIPDYLKKRNRKYFFL